MLQFPLTETEKQEVIQKIAEVKDALRKTAETMKELNQLLNIRVMGISKSIAHEIREEAGKISEEAWRFSTSEFRNESRQERILRDLNY